MFLDNWKSCLTKAVFPIEHKNLTKTSLIPRDHDLSMNLPGEPLERTNKDTEKNRKTSLSSCNLSSFKQSLFYVFFFRFQVNTFRSFSSEYWKDMMRSPVFLLIFIVFASAMYPAAGTVPNIEPNTPQGHPMTVFCKISLRRSKHCLFFIT